MNCRRIPPDVSRSLKEPEALLPEPRIILVAEDEDIVRQLLTRVLGNAGYRTLEARHGEEALQMATLAHPYLHLVITDVVMPRLDGRMLGHRLNERLPGLPVLYISAHPIDDLFHRGAPTPSACAIPTQANPTIAHRKMRLTPYLRDGRRRRPAGPVRTGHKGDGLRG